MFRIIRDANFAMVQLDRECDSCKGTGSEGKCRTCDGTGKSFDEFDLAHCKNYATDCRGGRDNGNGKCSKCGTEWTAGEVYAIDTEEDSWNSMDQTQDAPSDLRRLATVSSADQEIRAVGSHQGTDYGILITMSAMFLLFMFLFRRWAAKLTPQ